LAVKSWEAARALELEVSEEELEAERRAVLADRTYFRVCTRCGERKPDGCMHNARTCQSCAEEHLGVVH
jgi:hypothetical protein